MVTQYKHAVFLSMLLGVPNQGSAEEAGTTRVATPVQNLGIITATSVSSM